jgi:hypothetical protein
MPTGGPNDWPDPRASRRWTDQRHRPITRLTTTLFVFLARSSRRERVSSANPAFNAINPSLKTLETARRICSAAAVLKSRNGALRPRTIRANYAAAPKTGSCFNAGTYPSPFFFLLPFLESLNPSLQLNLSKSQRKEGDRPLLGSGRGYCIREEEVVSCEEESVVSER